MKKLKISKILVASLFLLGTISLNAHASDIVSESSKKLKKAEISEDRIKNIEKVLKKDLDAKNIDEATFQTIVDEIIEDSKLNKKDPKEKKIVSKPTTATSDTVSASSLWNLIGPGDIIIDHDMTNIGNTGIYLGHTAIVSNDKYSIWETLGYGRVVEKRSTSIYYDNMTHRQSWNYVPALYSVPTALANTGKNPENHKGKPYTVTTSKSTRDKFYCSKLVWAAYKDVTGYDLDNDGGYSVYPMDIYWDSSVQPYFQQNM